MCSYLEVRLECTKADIVHHNSSLLRCGGGDASVINYLPTTVPKPPPLDADMLKKPLAQRVRAGIHRAQRGGERGELALRADDHPHAVDDDHPLLRLRTQKAVERKNRHRQRNAARLPELRAAA